MKWLLRGLAVIVVVIVAYGVTANYVPKARVAAICVPSEALGINLGLIPLDRADWGYLKLRSGKAGLNALRDLEQHGATDKIRQTSAAVQMQWFEAGHVTYWGGDHLGGSNTQEKETRFNELRMPLDGKALRQDLLSGHQIPDDFWQAQRYRITCMLPPRSIAAGECVLRTAELTGSPPVEVILDTHTVGTKGEYVKSVVGHRLTVYQRIGTNWKVTVPHFRLCDEDQASASDGAFHLPPQKLDMLWINDHAVNFFNTDCFSLENEVPASTTGMSRAQAMTALLTHIQLLPSSKPIPSSLAAALANRSIVLSTATEPPMQEMALVGFQGLPPCFTARNPKACMAMVADIDHDGSDDVVITRSRGS